MLTGIDHLVIACADPDAAAVELEGSVGLRTSGGGLHPALGTFNRLVWLGDSYVELIGVRDRARGAASWIGAPTVRALEAGGGFATWAIASDDIVGDVAALRARGSEVGEPIPGERARPDGRLVRWRLAPPGRLGPDEPPFLIEHDRTAAEWTPDDRAGRAAEVHPVGGPVRLDVLELPVRDAGRSGMRLLRAVGIGPFRPSLAGRGARDAAIGEQTIRLRPSRATDTAGGGVGDGTGQAWPQPTIRLRLLVGARSDAAGALVRDVGAIGCRWIVVAGQADADPPAPDRR